MKTRAFDPETKQWRTDFIVSPAGSVFQTTHYKMDLWELEPRPNWKLSRFTDFFDTESKKIWQYDIVEVRGIQAVVHFEFGRFILVSEMYPDGYIEITDLITVEGKEAWLDVKVIGDVFLNPELLEV